MKNIKRFRTLALLLLLSLLSACTAEQPATNSNTQAARERVNGKSGGWLAYRLSSPPRTFNPVMADTEASLIISTYLTNSPLISFDHDSQKYVAAIAEGWKRSDDGRTVELTLRDGLKFSDGQPITAADIVFTLVALYDKNTPSPALRDALLINGKPLEATAVDARNLRLVFPEVVAAVENYIFNIPVMPRHALEEEFKQGKFGDTWSVTTEPQKIISSGPFVIAESKPGERVVLKRNPHYWKKDAGGVQLPYLDELVIEFIGDQNNAFTRLTQNTLDILDRVRASDYASLIASPGSVRGFDLGAGLSTDHMWFNLNDGERNGKPLVDPLKRAWFTDSRFRRAVAHAVDRETIAKSTMQGLATPLYGFVSPGNRAWAATDLPRAEYNLDTARALLQEAGFVVKGTAEAPELHDAKGNRVEWTLLVQVENEPRKLQAAVIQEDLAKLGMRVQVAPIETQALRERMDKSFDYDAILMGITLTDFEPSSYGNILPSSAATHQWHPLQEKPATDWEAKIDELFAQQAKEPDPAKRREQFREIQRLMGEQMPIIPIVARHLISAANTRVGNYRPSAILPFSLWNAEELFIK